MSRPYNNSTPSPRVVSVAIFRRVSAPTGSSWNLIQTVTASITNGALRTVNLAISANGNVIAVAASSSGGALSGGALFIYRYNPAAGQWLLEQTITRPIATPANFGDAVTISADGRCLAVGNPPSDPGTAGYVTIIRSSASCSGSYTWTIEQNIIAPDSNIFFGYAAALSPEGEFLLVGAPSFLSPALSSVYLYRYRTNTWQLTQTIVPNLTDASLGLSVALAEQARYALITGVSGLANKAATLFYGLNHAALLTPQATFIDSSHAYSFFPPKTGLSADGVHAMSYFAIDESGPFANPIYLFVRYDDSWQPNLTLTFTAYDPTATAALSLDGLSVAASSITANSLVTPMASFIYSAASDTIPSDLITSGSLCMDQLVTVTGSLYVAGNITHSGSFGLTATTLQKALLLTQLKDLEERQHALLKSLTITDWAAK